MKRVTILIGGAPEPDNLREATLQEGTTVADLKRALGLQGYLLRKMNSENFLPDEMNLFMAVEDGEKLICATQATVGNGLLEAFRALFGLGQPDQPSDSGPFGSRTVEEPTPPRSIRGVLIKPNGRPYWEHRGWQRVGNKLQGAFQSPWGPIYGEVIHLDGQPLFYLHRPPKALLNHPRHGPCLRDRGAGIFWVHFSQPPRDVDAGLLAIEQLLGEVRPNGRRY